MTDLNFQQAKDAKKPALPNDNVRKRIANKKGFFGGCWHSEFFCLSMCGNSFCVEDS